jgi:hypothetical protein
VRQQQCARQKARAQKELPLQQSTLTETATEFDVDVVSEEKGDEFV